VLAKAALSAGVLILMLPLAEVFVRLVAPQALPSQEMLHSFVLRDMYVPDAEAGYRLAPEFHGRIERHGHVTEFSTNALGLRDDELPPKTTPRLLALGDSFTFGWGVPQGQEWVHQAGRALRELGLGPLRTVNGGVNGYGTLGALALLRRVGPEVKPDLVLLGFFANDFTDNLLDPRSAYTVQDGYLFDLAAHERFQESFWMRESHLVRLLAAARETFRVRLLGGVPANQTVHHYSPAEWRRGRERSARLILALDAACRKLGARFGVVWLPAEPFARNGRRPEEIALRWNLQQTVAAAGIPSLDLLPAVTVADQLDRTYLRDDGHFSVWGHELAGREIARWVAARGLLAPRAGAEPPRAR
jgi:lysophospholipase L1-like esterase